MDQFSRGVLTAGLMVISLFFFRFFQRDRDRFFLFFALSFFLLAADRFALAIATTYGVTTPVPYWARAFGYLLIVIAIIDKNMSKRSSSPF
jgi:hypothetical protein